MSSSVTMHEHRMASRPSNPGGKTAGDARPSNFDEPETHSGAAGQLALLRSMYELCNQHYPFVVSDASRDP